MISLLDSQENYNYNNYNYSNRTSLLSLFLSKDKYTADADRNEALNIEFTNRNTNYDQLDLLNTSLLANLERYLKFFIIYLIEFVDNFRQQYFHLFTWTNLTQLFRDLFQIDNQSSNSITGNSSFEAKIFLFLLYSLGFISLLTFLCWFTFKDKINFYYKNRGNY